MTKIRTLTANAYQNGLALLWLGTTYITLFSQTGAVDAFDAAAVGLALAGTLLIATGVLGTFALGLRTLIVGQ